MVKLYCMLLAHDNICLSFTTKCWYNIRDSDCGVEIDLIFYHDLNSHTPYCWFIKMSRNVSGVISSHLVSLWDVNRICWGATDNLMKELSGSRRGEGTVDISVLVQVFATTIYPHGCSSICRIPPADCSLLLISAPAVSLYLQSTEEGR